MDQDVTHVDFENGWIIIDSEEALLNWFGQPSMEVRLPEEPKQLGLVRVRTDEGNQENCDGPKTKIYND